MAESRPRFSPMCVKIRKVLKTPHDSNPMTLSYNTEQLDVAAHRGRQT